MPSSRSTIRNATYTALSDIANVNVYCNKVHDISRWKLPAINVLTPTESISKYSEKLEHRYSLDLVINIVDKHTDGASLADNLDALSNTVLYKTIQAFNNSTYINALSITPEIVEFSYEDGADKIYGSCVMKFRCVYQSDDGALTDSLEPLELYTYKIEGNGNTEKPLEGEQSY